MSVDGENAGAKLPSAFQTLSTPTSSTISKSVESYPNAVNHFHGYRSNFNVNEERAKYQQQRQHQPLPLPSPPSSPSMHQQNQYRPNHRQFNNKPRNNERFSTNDNHPTDSRRNTVGGRCEICDRNFKTQQQFDRHVSEHEKCCFDGCHFEAHSSILKKHIEAQHNSGLFQRINSIETEEDILKWREERRKRYPTRINIEARQLAQEQRLKRGERIVEPANRFGRNSDRRSANEGKNERKEQNKSSTKKKRPRKRRNNKTKKNTDKKSLDNDSTTKSEKAVGNVNTGIVRFAGISHMTTSTVSSPNVEPDMKNNALTALMGLYGDESSDDDNDDYVGSEVDTVAQGDEKKKFECESFAVDRMEDVYVENDVQKLNLTDEREAISSPTNVECNSDDDEPPELQSISHEIPEDDRLNECKAIEIENDRKRQNEQSSRQHEPKCKIPKKQSIFDLTKKIRHQNSLLEKLLQKDIRHERNVLLQCVRYVVEQDFFGVGQPTKK